jgi:4-hydroxy-3-methylbut-2-enyl diphosphate reductase
LCERKFPTFFINSDSEIKSRTEIHHFNYPRKQKIITHEYLPDKKPVRIVLTSGASCPDTLVDRVMLKLAGYFEPVKTVEEVIAAF